ncbi:5004_t:CDS:2, partial [Dentiscutata erythropus]
MSTNTQEILIFLAMCELMLQELEEEDDMIDRILLENYGILFNKISRPKTNRFWNEVFPCLDNRDSAFLLQTWLMVPFKNPEANLDPRYR